MIENIFMIGPAAWAISWAVIFWKFRRPATVWDSIDRNLALISSNVLMLAWVVVFRGIMLWTDS
jgi:hypothetical protein